MQPRYKTIFLLLLGCCFLLLSPHTHAADSAAAMAPHAVTPQQWQSLTSDKAFGYKNEIEKQQKQDDNTPGAFEKALEAILRFFGDKTFQVLLWGAIALVAIYIIYKLVLANGNIMFARKKKQLPGATGDPGEDLDLSNWEALLQNAIKNNDLQLAVRYSYMWLLQMLQEGELIRYREDKTNYDYYRELADTAYKQPFRQLSRQYEYVFYGNYKLSSAAYNEYIELFNKVKRQLGR